MIEGGDYRFTVMAGMPPESAKNGTKSGSSGSPFLCLMSGVPMPFDYLRSEAKASRMGTRLMAVVADGDRSRIYLEPTEEQEDIALRAMPWDTPETNLPERALGFRVQEYGMTKWRHLFTDRQLVALTTFSDLVGEARERIRADAVAAGTRENGRFLRDGGTGETAYAEAVGVYLAFAVDRMANTLCTIARWTPDRGQTVTAFARQAIPMTWDFPDVNPFAGAAGDYGVSVDGVIKGLSSSTEPQGSATQNDATIQSVSIGKLVSTDPPYYNNIGYADLSDFFYVWLRRSQRPVFPQLFATLAVPKAEELVATPYRHGSTKKAEAFFLDGMTSAMKRLAEQAHTTFPITIYYAFKQSETTRDSGVANTGWGDFLGGGNPCRFQHQWHVANPN